ncbi:MAG: DUF692 domain-containing protein [Hyphomicrobiaceae bacterium]|nr:DUF692 domain-containing protein [Hyphomicrobiaceae bacterium]
MSLPSKKPSSLGFGLGLRPPHYPEILGGDPPIDWFEILSENYMVPGGQPMRILDEINEKYPLVMHGVSMSIGSTAPLDMDYLRDLKKLAQRVKPKWISDHICWTGVHGLNMHDLLPLPMTQEALDHLVERIKQVQDFLGQPIALENASTYVTFKDDEMTEWDFINEMAEQADCLLLLDINNIYVSSFNHGFDPHTYVDAINPDRVVQFHLAGHQNNGTHIVDTHDHPVIKDVWDLYGRAIKRFGPVSTMIERDDNIPPLDELLEELEMARKIADQQGVQFPPLEHQGTSHISQKMETPS